MAGVILEEVLMKAEENGLFFPVNYGAKGSAQIGGAVSTNAGGTRVIRYGMMREQILGLEAVLSDGTKVSSMKKIIKDNSGFDWKHLLIGTEGIYGVITKAVLRLREKPISRHSIMMAMDNYDHVIKMLKRMDKEMGGLMSAYEVIWQDTYKALTTTPSNHKPPLSQEYPLYVLTEVLGSDQRHELEHIEHVVNKCMDEGLVEDAVIAHSYEDLKWLWGIREEVEPLLSYGEFHQTFDISLPIPDIHSVVIKTKKALRDIIEVKACFALGHIGDGNIHFIVLKDNDSVELSKMIDEIVYQSIPELAGSVSAEHGIGIDKLAYLHLSRSNSEIDLMRKIKSVLDPNNILNRGKVIP